MLKLEKVSKTLDINITLRKRERFFNRTFLQALGIALGLHIMAIVLFPIAMSTFRGSLAVLPPVSVAAELPSESSVTTVREEEEISPRYLRPPRSIALARPSWPAPELPPLELLPMRREPFPRFLPWKKRGAIPFLSFSIPNPMTRSL